MKIYKITKRTNIEQPTVGFAYESSRKRAVSVASNWRKFVRSIGEKGTTTIEVINYPITGPGMIAALNEHATK